MIQGIRYHQVLVSKHLGGGEKLALQIHSALERRASGSSELLVPADGETEKYARESALRHRTYPLDALMGKGLASLAANFELWRRLRGQGLSALLHVHSPFVYGAMRPMLAMSQISTVVHLHLDYSHQELEWALRRSPSLIILCAGFMRDRVSAVLDRHGHRGTRLAVVMNAVDTGQFASVDRTTSKRAFGIPENRPVLLMAADLAEHKGQKTAIRAVARLRDGGRNPLLWLVGEEREPRGYSEELQALIGELGLQQHVQFLGYRNDVHRLLAAADALLLPSRQEGLPLAILEAQAARVPVLAAPTAGIPEVIEHGRTGFLIDSADDSAYAAVLENLLSLPQTATELAEAAYRQVTANLDIRNYERNIVAAYRLLNGDSS
jgi:glycosyltransferase involved in cell wall biosynthesis